MTNAQVKGPLAELPTVWRQRADVLRRHGAAEAAATAETLAEELADALRAALSEALSLDDASRESGYSVDYLSRRIRKGFIPNAGRKHAPAIRRSDLPRKASAEPLPLHAPSATSRAQIAQSVADSYRGHDDD
ncbi:MAG TPA: hypothetical protein VF102_00885 [Gemmatimonadaceae bacterium]